MSSKNPTDTAANSQKMAFGKWNYILMVVGVVLIIIGLFLLSGGRSNDPKVFDETIFNSQRLVVAPLVMLCGFVVEIVAIMKKN